MKKILIYSLIFILLLVLVFSISSYEIKNDDKIVNYDLGQDLKNIYLLNKNNEIVFTYQISEFKDWAKNNWIDIFEEKPVFGEVREVEIDNFNNFSKELSISNNKKKLAFWVSDYAVLTDISFITFIDLNNYSISMIHQEIIGSIRDIIWSDNDKYIAYLLDTARTYGDYIRIDEMRNKSKLAIIEREEILDYLEIANNQELLTFSDISWKNNENILNFTSLIGDDNEKYYWQYEINENKLKIINNN